MVWDQPLFCLRTQAEAAEVLVLEALALSLVLLFLLLPLRTSGRARSPREAEVAVGVCHHLGQVALLMPALGQSLLPASVALVAAGPTPTPPHWHLG